MDSYHFHIMYYDRSCIDFTLVGSRIIYGTICFIEDKFKWIFIPRYGFFEIEGNSTICKSQTDKEGNPLKLKILYPDVDWTKICKFTSSFLANIDNHNKPHSNMDKYIDGMDLINIDEYLVLYQKIIDQRAELKQSLFNDKLIKQLLSNSKLIQ